MLAELLERGIDVDAADLVIGTSAGSVAGSILRFGQVSAVYESQITAGGDLFADRDATASDTTGSDATGSGTAGSGTAASGSATPPAPLFDMATFGERLQSILVGADSPQDARARLGRAAIEVSAGAESPLLAQLAAQFPAEYGWPTAGLGVCVVEATTGEFRVLDGTSGVPLSLAVAASCSVPLVFPPVRIDGSDYVDGGVRSATNADVATGYDKVLVLSCGPEDPASPMGPQLDQAAATLRAGSESTPPADVLVLTADAASIEAFGTNSLADTSRVPSARAGRAQAAGLADAVRAFWA